MRQKGYTIIRRKFKSGAEAMVTRLFVGEIEEVLNDLKQMNATKEGARSAIDRLLGYLMENKGRMHDKHARKGGYPIGSGGIESSNKTVCHICRWMSYQLFYF